MSARDPLTDEELLDMERLAGIDLGVHAEEGDGQKLHAMVIEIRALRAVAAAARLFVEAQDPLAQGDFAGDKYEYLRRALQAR